MQEKTIKSILKKKITEWVSSITDENLRASVSRDVMVSGGAITSLLLGEKPNDFDVYFKTKETTESIAKYYVDLFKSNPPSKFKDRNKEVQISVLVQDDRVKIVVKSQGVASEDGTQDYQYFEQPNVDPSEPQEFVESVAEVLTETQQKKETDKGAKYRPIFLTSNAITLSDKIQIVIRFFGPIETIHENFDYVHCTCSYDYQTNELNIPQSALMSLINRRLKYKRSKYPVCSLIRARKFIKNGWHIDAGQFVKITWDISKLNLEDVNVLEDQMLGVDSAYFQQVIELLREHQSKSEGESQSQNGQKIDDTYLMQVIDLVFG